jgi:hypothetical protein
MSFRAVARNLARRNTMNYQDFSLRCAPFEMTKKSSRTDTHSGFLDAIPIHFRLNLSFRAYPPVFFPSLLYPPVFLAGWRVGGGWWALHQVRDKLHEKSFKPALLKPLGRTSTKEKLDRE